MSPALHTELWTSWASLLRSYAAAHGLNGKQQGVVEVSATEITLRVGAQWLQFRPASVVSNCWAASSFALLENGTVLLDGGTAEEMDFAAERVVRELMSVAG